MLCFLWISDFQGPTTWRWLGWVNGRTSICVLGKGVGKVGYQYPLDFLHFASITSTTWPSFIGEVVDDLFLEQDHVEASSLCLLEVWTLFQILSGVGLGPHSFLLLEVMGLWLVNLYGRWPLYSWLSVKLCGSPWQDTSFSGHFVLSSQVSWLQHGLAEVIMKIY